ncbi:MAG: glycosyltransferase [bacterium]|nr:glycosyltransferase [bacterium]
MRLSVIIPVFNEINTIEEIVRRVQVADYDKEIIIVDDGSTDGTVECLQRLQQAYPEIKVVFKEDNEGKGAAIREAVPFVTGDAVVIQDADLEYYPDELGAMMKIIADGKAEVVFGTRFQGQHRVFLFTHYLASKFLTVLCNLLFNTILSDMGVCYKMFRADLFKTLPLRANGFGFDAEVAGYVFRKRYIVYEMPISYNGRSYEDGKKLRWTDLFPMLYWLLRVRLTTIDIGEETLCRLQSVNRYYQIFYERIEHLIGRRIIEIGSGNGNFTRFLLGRDVVVATDLSENHLRTLRQRFVENDRVHIYPYDAAQSPSDEIKSHRADTLVCLNVLEHIEDDRAALRGMRETLVKGGRMILLVPCIKALFGSMDVGLDHFRRYTKKELVERVKEAGFEIEDTFFYNMWGVPGWFVNGRIFRRKVLPKYQLYFFTLLHPLVRMERYFKTPFGLSVIVIAKKV